jgi:hypothetical protein
VGGVGARRARRRGRAGARARALRLEQFNSTCIPKTLVSLPQQKCEYSDWQSKRPVLPVDSRVYGHIEIDLYLFCEYKQINANTGKPTCWFGEGLSDCKVRQNNKGCGGWDKKDPLAGAAGEEASLCVVFQRNASTAMPDLDSGVGTGLGDRVVFLDRVAYCPLQYALRSPTMNRVEMESSLSSSCSDKNTSVPASAKVRILGAVLLVFHLAGGQLPLA